MQFFDKIINKFTAKDFLGALPDAICMANGGSVRYPHFFAEQLCETGHPLRAAAYAAGLLSKGFSGEVQAAVIQRGLISKDFVRALGIALQATCRAQFDLQAKHLAFVPEIQIDRLGDPVELGQIDLSTAMADTTYGASNNAAPAQWKAGESLTLSSYGRIITIPRTTIFDDEFELLSQTVNEIGLDAGRHESQMVATALEANGVLADGQVTFHTNYGNVVTTAFGEAGLGACIAALRNQVDASGMKMDFTVAHLVVSASLELAAAKVVRDAGLPIQLTAMAGLPAARYFVTAQRGLTKNIAVARLRGESHALAVEPARPEKAIDGVALKVRIDSGAALIGRKGIVRGGA